MTAKNFQNKINYQFYGIAKVKDCYTLSNGYTYITVGYKDKTMTFRNHSESNTIEMWDNAKETYFNIVIK